MPVYMQKSPIDVSNLFCILQIKQLFFPVRFFRFFKQYSTQREEKKKMNTNPYGLHTTDLKKFPNKNLCTR